MTDSLLLDTHIIPWLDSGDDRLRPSTRALIDGCWRSGGTIFLSAVTAWEIALLVDTGRIDLDVPVEAWVKRFLERPGIEAVPLGHGPATRAYQLHHFEHRDPADRLLIATAVELACPLVTYDERIARFGKKHGRQYRFAVAATVAAREGEADDIFPGSGSETCRPPSRRPARRGASASSSSLPLDWADVLTRI